MKTTMNKCVFSLTNLMRHDGSLWGCSTANGPLCEPGEHRATFLADPISTLANRQHKRNGHDWPFVLALIVLLLIVLIFFSECWDRAESLAGVLGVAAGTSGRHAGAQDNDRRYAPAGVLY